MSKNILLVLGASSDIGINVAKKFAQEGFDIQLAGRNSYRLENDCSNLRIRYNVNANFYELDALDVNSHEKFVASLPELPNVVISAIGLLGDQSESELEIKKNIVVIRSNFEGVISLFSIFANYFIERGNGTLIGISSVAGDRGRASNYIYGSAKAGLNAFLSGLRNRLFPFGINVITVKPGYVRTKMTKGLKLPRALTADPKKVSCLIYKAYINRKDILYVLPIWKLIMFIIKIIPESIFKKMNL
mgnify:CR=1 FL=1|tara:strand:- start:663 stop:1400 length:738 start_codon:yes stop_codon:yes gene_type:complete